MTSRHRALPLLALVAVLAPAAVAAPAPAVTPALPVQCETGAETVLAWDDVAYDLRGTCGVVRISGEPNGEVVRLTVRDQGVGIPEEQQSRIFTKFFRGDAAASGIAGSGLGLAFAKAVVEAHGGRLSFTSTAGQGSTFRVELPRSEPGR